MSKLKLYIAVLFIGNLLLNLNIFHMFSHIYRSDIKQTINYDIHTGEQYFFVILDGRGRGELGQGKNVTALIMFVV